MTPKAKKSSTPFRPKLWKRELYGEVLGGYLGGMAKFIVFHPLDTLTTVLESKKGLRFGPVAAFRLIIQEKGFRGLYAGLPTTLLFGLPYAAVYHSSYFTVLKVLHNKSAWSNVFAGGFAAVTGAGVGVPSECLKHRLQSGMYRSIPDAMKSIASSGGPQTLYAGFGATLLRNVPYNAIQFGTFVQLQHSFRQVMGREPTAAEDAALGTVAGLTTALLTNPFDVVNTRLQVQPVQAIGSSIAQYQYKGIQDCFVGIVRDEGVAGLFKGVLPRLAAYGPSGALFFAVYQRTKDLVDHGDASEENNLD